MILGQNVGLNLIGHFHWSQFPSQSDDDVLSFPVSHWEISLLRWQRLEFLNLHSRTNLLEGVLILSQ